MLLIYVRRIRFHSSIIHIYNSLCMKLNIYKYYKEVVHAWNMYTIKSQKPCTTHVFGISCATLIFRRRMATRFFFFRVVVVRAVGINDPVHKKS
jgi:hypothetical protein